MQAVITDSMFIATVLAFRFAEGFFFAFHDNRSMAYYYTVESCSTVF